MDPVTTAIVTALTVGAGKVAEKIFIDAYERLKTNIKKKYGENSDLAEAVKQLEKKPGSAHRQGVLHEEVEAAQADKDPEILGVAQALLEKLKAEPGGMQVIQNVYGDYSAVSGPGGISTVNIDKFED